MKCKSGGCEKTWNPGEEFPFCFNYPCPLLEFRNESISARGIRFKPLNHFVNNETPKLKTETESSLTVIRNSTRLKCHRFHPYEMKGAQKATTTIKLKNGTVKKFSTTNNKHSEMMAVDWMLSNGHWTLYLGTIIWSDDLKEVTDEQFKTSEPHCGFCTVMLQVLGLPHSRPTKGNHNYACNLNYPLPVLIKQDPYVLARLLSKNSYCGFSKIKAVLNSLINIDKDKWVLSIQNLAFVNEKHYVTPGEGVLTLEWQDVIKQSSGEVLNQIWKLVFECIYQTNDNKTN